MTHPTTHVPGPPGSRDHVTVFDVMPELEVFDAATASSPSKPPAGD